MYIFLSKFLPHLFLPVGLVVEFIVLALLFQLSGKRKTSTVFMLAALLVLWASSTPLVAGFVYGKLEQVYPPVAMEDIPARKCIVLLGDSVGTVVPPRVDFDMFDNSDRVRMAARLQHMGKGQHIFVITGNSSFSPLGQSEAELTAILLGEWGVPAPALVLDSTSRNTRENALVSANLLKKRNCGLPLLVTSAAHMPRSVAAFRKAGVDVFPVSTDIRVTEKSKLVLHDWTPNVLSLKMTSDAIREWMGQKVYEFRDWN